MGNDQNKNGPGIVDDITVETQQWLECFIAFGTAQSVISLAVTRMRDAKTEAERDSIRSEVWGFLRRLSLGMLAIAVPGDVVTESEERP